MTLAFYDLVTLIFAFFFVALLYSSVGFGGGSSYLALLALFISSFFVIRSMALICNLIVVTSSSALYYKSGLFRIKAFFPFTLTSIPMAFIAANFRLHERVFFILLGITLLTGSLALVAQTFLLKSNSKQITYSHWYSYAIGGGVGLLSGLVGIGGGIFLAPILNYMRWKEPHQIAALGSFFILVNSLSGILGLVNSGTFKILWPESLLLVIAVFVGGQLGVRLSLIKLSPNSIRLFTALLVFLVGLHVLLK